MIVLLLVFTIIHAGFNIYILLGWISLKDHSQLRDDVGFTIIIPVRNEENDISRVLACIAHQEYPKEKFEVIVVNDFSEDETLEKLKECKKKLDLNFRVISLDDPSKSGKKYALTKGVELAQFDNILTTDADCRMGPQWLASYAGSFEDNEMVAGPVAISGRGFFADLQQTEFSWLLGFGAVTLERNDPSMCSGANLGFTKKAFNEVRGYQNNIQIPSGDDEFLLYNILKRFPGKATFLKNRSALVLTSAHGSFKSFVNQRKRWTSKWKYNKNSRLRLTAILYFVDYSLFIVLMLGWLMGYFQWGLLAILFSIRLASDFLFVGSISRLTGKKGLFSSLVILQIIYPFHVLFMGLNSIFGSYTWKGRKY